MGSKKVFLIFLFFLGIISPTNAILIEGEEFILKIDGAKINSTKLLELCTPESCVIKEHFVILRSYYNESVAIEVGRGKNYIQFILPFKYVSFDKGVQVISDIDPKKYNWKESVKTDLTFLKAIGILNISDSEIAKISGIAEGGYSIVYCRDKWNKLKGLGCYCGKICQYSEEVRRCIRECKKNFLNCTEPCGDKKEEEWENCWNVCKNALGICTEECKKIEGEKECEENIVCLESFGRPTAFLLPEKSLSSFFSNLSLPAGPSTPFHGDIYIILTAAVIFGVIVVFLFIRKIFK